MTADQTTLRFYAQEAAAYTSRGQKPSLHIEAFLNSLPPKATILELGCGGGQDSEFMIAKGFSVRPTDGTPEIAKAAENRLKIPVDVLLFGDLNEDSAYDGIWANASLLHVPKAELLGILRLIHRALKAGGLFYASFKSGQSDGRDEFDRYYNYPSEDWLAATYGTLQWQKVNIKPELGSGYDQKPTEWLHVVAVK
jgi:2-polyprenyl-3-methyl-5-hydroxy-6-metoxy-1,4-benzoquinol methylase